MLKKHSTFWSVILFFSDIFFMVLSLYLAWEIRKIPAISFLTGKSATMIFSEYQFYFPTVILIYVPAFYMSRLYDPMRGSHPLREMMLLFKAQFTALIVLFAVTALFFPRKEFSRSIPLFFAAISTVLIYASRFSIRSILRYLRAHGKNVRRVIIAGKNTGGERLKEILNDHPEYGYIVSGFLNAGGRGKGVIGSFKNVDKVIKKFAIDEVVISQSGADIKDLMRIIQYCDKEGVRLRMIPNYAELMTHKASIDDIGGVPILSFHDIPLFKTHNILIKRAFDVFFSLLFIVCSSPLMVLIALLIKMSSKGPVFYSQERLGIENKVFKIFKFRTMHIDAEDKTGPIWAKDGDARVTCIGRFLRKTSLDEIPQFFNALLGHMSVVGPRPERPYFVNKFKEYVPDYMRRHMVKSGITGWAQVLGYRGNTNIEKRIQSDLYYIENWSLVFDIWIILLTPFLALYHRNAY